AYPIDGYKYSGIKRLARLQEIVDGLLPKEKAPLKGQMKSINDIKLHLLGTRGDSLATLPPVDSALQKAINGLFGGLSSAYSIAVLDISPGRPIRYAQRKEMNGYQPGSVGKLAVIAGLFCELKEIYPESYEKRLELIRNKVVRGSQWAMSDEHTIPIYNPETKKFLKRTVIPSDTFSVLEWADHMISVSNNGAAAVVWREAMLMRIFGKDYPTLTEAQANEYFKATPKSQLTDIAISVVNDPLQDIGISREEWRLGTLFTRGAGGIVPGKGGSSGCPYGLMKYLVAMERGKIVDPESSLEIKRLMYSTDRRIRYASSKDLANAAVYFKSGSLYKCRPEEGYTCGKYKGNLENYMNSVAIVEHGDSLVYMVTLMSNVLKKNSGTDHMVLAGRIEKIIRGL
ncbi:MAG TPA: serine hydrolase, partial [Bacteroidia bacterium]|nr:serine hydrolase [Bacteroidia bacterium]